MKHVSKPLADLAYLLPHLYPTKKTLDQSSKAEERSSIIRTGIFYLNRIANDLSGASEISGPMAAAAYLSFGTFWVTYAWVMPPFLM